MSYNILITGGCGFIGSSLAKSLLADGHKVILIDNFSTGRAKNIEDINDMNATLHNWDLSDPWYSDKLDKLLKDVDVCYHLAASIGVKLVQEDPKGTFLNSTKINDVLFPLFEKHNTKVIYSSTSEVYGETKKATGSEETDKLEIYPVQKPRGSYACSKLFSEFLIRSYNFPSVIVRFFNIVGPSQVQDYGHVLPKFINSAKNNRDVTVFHDGTQVRSYCDIRDCVEMLKLLLDDKHNSEIYNIGNSENVCNVATLAQTVIDLTKSKSRIINIPFEEALGSQFEEIYIRFPNTQKISKYYKCKYNLEEIILNILNETK
jgi:UDP-glucose 4-epimerase